MNRRHLGGPGTAAIRLDVRLVWHRTHRLRGVVGDGDGVGLAGEGRLAAEVDAL